jgi:hypothetical protein
MVLAIEVPRVTGKCTLVIGKRHLRNRQATYRVIDVGPSRLSSSRGDRQLIRLVSTRVAMVAIVVLSLGCGKDPDPTHFHLGDFSTGPALTDTLRRLIPPGTQLTSAWEIMQGNGFKCGERAGVLVDSQTHKLGSGAPSLQCWQSTQVGLGLRRRDWTVTLRHDTSGVHDVFASYIVQP